MNDQLSVLLDIVSGSGKFRIFGQGITTYPTADENNKNIHKGCLELETLGCIHRHQVRYCGGGLDSVLWMPGAEVT